MTLFIRVLDASVDDKATTLLGAVRAYAEHSERESAQRILFERGVESFLIVPGTPFCYWVTGAVLKCFRRPRQQPFTAKLGLKTDDDFRFIRLWFELPAHTANYRPLAKGGSFSRTYGDIHLLLQWNDDGWELKSLSTERWGNPGKRIFNEAFYFRPGLTWSRRSQVGLSLRVMPCGCIFGDKGPAAVIDGDASDDLLALLAIMTSAPFCYLVSLQMAFGSYEVGVIQRTPVPRPTSADIGTLAKLARRAWTMKRSLDTSNETSHAFLLPALANNIDRNAVEQELETIQKRIDDEVFRLYGIGGDDRAPIESPATAGTNEADGDESDEGGDESDEGSDESSDKEVDVALRLDQFHSWLVGVTFGRFDPRLATGERATPSEPEPFDPLPARSPGMWPADEERPEIPPDIMVDDSGHDHDIRALVANAAAKTGWPDPEDLRQWLAKEFFPLHIKMYSKSHRKAPIYWQLATPSASYSVWLYIHAFTKDTLFRVQNDYVAPKLAFEEQRLRVMRRDGGFTEETDPTPYETKRIDEAVAEALGKPRVGSKTSATARKELANQETFVEELRAFLDEVKRVAPLWNPNLDDGVIINFSLLWRLVPQHKPWQKELKATWDALCAGEYDWAHLAMHLWPERVVPKCAKDRSLAIAHGLEEVFWVEGSDGKWTSCKTPTTRVAELIRERTSPAVQDALERLLKASAPSAGGTKKKAVRKKAVRMAKPAKATGGRSL